MGKRKRLSKKPSLEASPVVHSISSDTIIARGVLDQDNHAVNDEVRQAYKKANVAVHKICTDTSMARKWNHILIKTLPDQFPGKDIVKNRTSKFVTALRIKRSALPTVESFNIITAARKHGLHTSGTLSNSAEHLLHFMVQGRKNHPTAGQKRENWQQAKHAVRMHGEWPGGSKTGQLTFIEVVTEYGKLWQQSRPGAKPSPPACLPDMVENRARKARGSRTYCAHRYPTSVQEQQDFERQRSAASYTGVSTAMHNCGSGRLLESLKTSKTFENLENPENLKNTRNSGFAQHHPLENHTGAPEVTNNLNSGRLLSNFENFENQENLENLGKFEKSGKSKGSRASSSASQGMLTCFLLIFILGSANAVLLMWITSILLQKM